MRNINWLDVLKRGDRYTWTELRKKINPVQPALADSIITELIMLGKIEEKTNRIYQIKT